MKKLNLPKEEIIELYNSGYGCYKIAKKYGCSASSINNLLKSEGVDTKKNPNNYRKYKLNEDYFSVIDNETKAYFLGLIYSDGCISRTSLRLSLQEEDDYILNKFLNVIESESKLYHLPKRIESHKNQKLVSISNIKMVNDLYNLGVTKKKSLIIKFPNNDQVPDEYLNHFVRGVFDGDGSVFKYERLINDKKYIESGVSITSSNYFIIELFNRLKFGNIYQTNNDKNLVLSFKKKIELRKIFEYLYKDSTIYLTRKYSKFLEILDIIENKKFFYSGEKIVQYDLNDEIIKIWDNLLQIKEQTDFNTQTILRNIKGKIKTSNGFKFKIYDR
jgi:hypothetical protein